MFPARRWLRIMVMYRETIGWCGRVLVGLMALCLANEPASASVPKTAVTMADVLGAGVVAQIDNLIISGCNAENLLDLAEWRACFPNATNIIHAAAGKDGYDFFLRHALLYHSPEIKWLYEMPESFSLDDLEEKK